MPHVKQRHGCLTAWLTFIILANAFIAVILPLMPEQVQQEVPRLTNTLLAVVVALSVLNILFAIALLSWQKWGFYGFAANAVAAFGVNLWAGVGLLETLLGLAGVAILYLLLRLGGERSAWAQMSGRPHQPPA